MPTIPTRQTFYVVIGKRYQNGQIWDVQYIASYQGDGYLYFNDDKFWRCKIDKTHLQIFYISKEIWVDTDMIQFENIYPFKVSSASNGASSASNAQVEEAVQWMIDKAENQWITYSMSDRNLKNPNGSSYDCSSFVITGFYAAGIDVDAYATPSMRAGFEAEGFEWIPGNYFDAADCKRGDILLNENSGANGHTQVYIGNNQDVNCGSTPARVCSHSPDNYGRGWHGILRLA